MRRQTEGCSGKQQNKAQQWLQSLAVTEVTRRSQGEKDFLDVGKSIQALAFVRKAAYLVQVGHEVLVERADQHVEGPLTLLGKRWRLQCGFLSIDYCTRRRKIRVRNKRKGTEMMQL